MSDQGGSGRPYGNNDRPYGGGRGGGRGGPRGGRDGGERDANGWYTGGGRGGGRGGSFRGGGRDSRGGRRDGNDKRRYPDDGADGDRLIRNPFPKESTRPPRERAEGEEKDRKMKMACVVSYTGTGYKGLQINPGTKTIEGELEAAMHAAGLISDENHHEMSKLRWTRAARTDKGVHAAGNVVALRMDIPDEKCLTPAAIERYKAEEAKTAAAVKALADRVRAMQSPSFYADVAAAEARIAAAQTAANAPVDEDGAVPVYTPPEQLPGEVINCGPHAVRVQKRDAAVLAAITESGKLLEKLSHLHTSLIDGDALSARLSADLNAHLPDQIRVLRVERVASSFDSKTCASSRTYEYILPSFAFIPVSEYPEGLHAQMLKAIPPFSAQTTDAGAAAAVAAAAGADGDAAVSEDAAEAAAPATGELSATADALRRVLLKMDAAAAGDDDAAAAAAADAEEGGAADDEGDKEDAFSSSAHGHADADADAAPLSAPGAAPAAAAAAPSLGELAAQVRESLEKLGIPECPPEFLNYRMSSSVRNNVDDILSTFIGTLNYHNFTKGRTPKDPSCRRYIDSCVTTGFFYMNGVEFVHVVVHGQSFMLHQIRKMIGYSVALARGTLNPQAQHGIFTQDRYRVPMAPALGLLLDRVHFRIYDMKTAENTARAAKLDRPSDARLTMDEVFNRVASERVKLKEERIYPEICARELALQSCWTWLHWANDVTYWGCPQDDGQGAPSRSKQMTGAVRTLRGHNDLAQTITKGGAAASEEDSIPSELAYVNVVAKTTAALPSFARQELGGGDAPAEKNE
jgi:tRNA U38,U39,U40 pseudouridine synthase TruA